MQPLISICIPAYKNITLLKRLLDSVMAQSFKHFEVIVSDDSPDTSAEVLCKNYTGKFQLTYIKNISPLGSPANWNNAIRHARGKWIKIMHHDDWFAHAESLKAFADAALTATTGFIFSAYTLYKHDHCFKIERLDKVTENLLRKNPLILFRKNYIGHPSTTLIRNNLENWYDEKIKWVVDFEFYIRILKQTRFIYLNEPLINIGLGEHQITSQVFRNRSVEIPENIYLLNKLGKKILANIVVYDYYWRLLRNLQIRNWKEFEAHAKEKIPVAVKRMFELQRRIPLKALNKGILSKTLMFTSYLKEMLIVKK